MGLIRLRAAALLALLALTLLSPATALAQADGVLAVAVQNGTAGAAIPEDIDLELLGFQGEVLSGTWREFERAADDRLTVTGLESGPDWTYVVTAVHRGLVFASDPVGFGDSKFAEAGLVVYEPTERDPGATLNDYSLVLAREADGARIRAVHTLTFQLPGDRALLVEPASPLLRFPLPPDTESIAALAGPASWQVGSEGRELLGAATLPPGQSTFSFEYEFPWDRAGQDLPIRPPADADRFRVWGVESQVAIAAPGLQQQPGLQMNERARLAIFEGRDLVAGEAVAVRIRDPGYGLVDRLVVLLERRAVALGAVLGGIALVVVAGLRQHFRRRRRLLLARQLLASAGGGDDAAAQLAALLNEDPDLARRLRPGVGA